MGKGASPSPLFFALGVMGPMADIEQINRQALEAIAAASTPEALEALRVSLLGKQGSVTALLKGRLCRRADPQPDRRARAPDHLPGAVGR